jgi:BioD-like phosphotransacetylase family protein
VNIVAALYVSSISEKAGKTLVGVGLAKIWQEAGKKVGYLKLLASTSAGQVDGDIAFAKQILALDESLEQIGAVVNPRDLEGSVKAAYAQVSAGKDLVIIEGLPLADSSEIIQALGAKALVVHDYASALSISLAVCQKLKGSCLGVVLNKVPRSRVTRYRSQSSEALSKAGLDLLGVLPEDRSLMTLSIAELAAAVQGKINNSLEKSAELIENFMLGASTFDRGPAYYNRKANKAVILWGERPGVRKAALAGYQIAALGTSTKSIVLSANTVPAANVAEQAAAKGVPVISAPGDVASIISALDAFMGKLKFGQEKKMPKLLGLLQHNLDLSQLSRKIGLAS